MRTDPKKSAEFTESSAWNGQRYNHKIVVPDTSGLFKYRVNSFSGHEANHFFLRNKDSFLDLTLVSGVDHLGDGRGFALLDFDRDGWLDIALISTNAPRFQLYRNRLGDLYSKNGHRRLRLEGAQRDGNANRGRSNRDGIGSKVWIKRKSGKKMLVQKQLGQGNVAQNSQWIWISQPETDPATEIEVVWPSGRSSQIELDDSEDDIIVKEPVIVGPF